jgi:hypothetical protein
VKDMELINELQKRILSDIYDMEFNKGQDIIHIDYGLAEENNRYAAVQGLVFYIEQLRRLGYLNIEYNPDNKYYMSGGGVHSEYKNNVIQIWSDKVHLSDKGIEYIIESRKTKKDKFKEFIKKRGKIFLLQLEKETYKIVIAFIFGTLFGKYVLPLIENLFKSLSK